MITVYEQRGIEQGIEQGIVIGERRTLLRQMNQKFGPVPEAIVARIQSISDVAELERLSDQILQATTVEEMGLSPISDG